ncbi:MAG TPA: zinc ribbon domain-containing protein, partial [Anaerolineae bacterium]|nr:zinc ribbon domain-containing protein [Anaerolineae bacterium]
MPKAVSLLVNSGDATEASLYQEATAGAFWIREPGGAADRIPITAHDAHALVARVLLQGTADAPGGLVELTLAEALLLRAVAQLTWPLLQASPPTAFCTRGDLAHYLAQGLHITPMGRLLQAEAHEAMARLAGCTAVDQALAGLREKGLISLLGAEGADALAMLTPLGREPAAFLADPEQTISIVATDAVDGHELRREAFVVQREGRSALLRSATADGPVALWTLSRGQLQELLDWLWGGAAVAQALAELDGVLASPAPAPQPAPEPRRFCPQCGRPVAPGSRFCGGCGAQATGPAAPARVPGPPPPASYQPAPRAPALQPATDGEGLNW